MSDATDARPLALVTGASSGIGFELARHSPVTASTSSSPRRTPSSPPRPSSCARMAHRRPQRALHRAPRQARRARQPDSVKAKVHGRMAEPGSGQN
jgi:hypothetical protein